MKFDPYRPSTYTPFIRRFTDERARDLADTIELHRRVTSAHQASPWAQEKTLSELTVDIADIVGDSCEAPDNKTVLTAFATCQGAILALEKTIFDTPSTECEKGVLSLKEHVDLRRFLRAQEHFLANQGKVIWLLLETVATTFTGLADHMSRIPQSSNGMTVPLHTFVSNLNEVVDKIIGTFCKEELTDVGLFAYLQNRFYENTCAASGIVPYEESKKRMVSAVDSTLPPDKLISTYLRDTPFLDLFNTSVPFEVPEETRFAGTWIVAPSGKGKTTLLHNLLLEDMKKDAAIVVMDSKGDLTEPVSRCKDLKDRLIVLDPSQMNIALNPFDMTEGVHIIALLEYIFSSILETKLTGKQSAVFRPALRAALFHPKPNIESFRNILQSGVSDLSILPEKLRKIFTEEFDKPIFKGTRDEILYRLQLLLENEAISAMFSAPESKLNFEQEIDAGKIIVIRNSQVF